MPKPRCHFCASDIVLDISTYWNYKGSVTCEHCKQQMGVVFSGGELLRSEPRIDPELIEGLSDRIPTQPREDYFEAVQDYADKHFRSSAVMCRRALQGALLEKGISDKKPSLMVQEAVSTKLLPGKLLKLADTVTFFGNSGAHPQDDELRQVSKLESLQGLRITRQILVSLFPQQQGSYTAWRRVTTVNQ